MLTPASPSLPQCRARRSIAAQLHNQKIEMEAQIREQLEAEYRRDGPGGNGEAAAAAADDDSVNELKEQLRDQLLKVKEERDRWQVEQEKIQSRLVDSQGQFAKVREGYKSKWRARVAETTVCNLFPAV